MASDRRAMGRRSPWAATRAMCSSGFARSHTVVLPRREQIERGRVVHEPAAAGEHERRRAREQRREHVAFEAAVVALAVHREDLGEREARGFLDLRVELDERDAEALRDEPPHGALARAAQAEEGEAHGATVDQQLGRAAPEGGRELGQPDDRDVPAAGLDVGEEAGGHAGRRRQLGEGPAPAAAPLADGVAEADEEGTGGGIDLRGHECNI